MGSEATLKLGIVGCGVIGRQHVAAAVKEPRVDLVALADLDQKAAEALAAEHGVPRAYGDAAALLSDQHVEAVVLALPAGVRGPFVLEALKAGKHVLIEKPAGLNAAEIDRFIAARGDRVVSVCSSRFALMRVAAEARRLVESGALGPLRVVRCRGLTVLGPPPKQPPPAWRLSHRLNGGGIMSNWGCYDLNFLFEATGWQLRPREVLARVWECPERIGDRAAPGSDAETHVAGFITCDDGVAFTLERGEFLPLVTEPAWEITGETGSLRMNMLPWRKQAVLIHDRAVPEKGVESSVLLAEPEGEDLTGLVVADFAAAVLDGRPPRTTLEQSLLIQRLTDAIYASNRHGRSVRI